MFPLLIFIILAPWLPSVQHLFASRITRKPHKTASPPFMSHLPRFPPWLRRHCDAVPESSPDWNRHFRARSTDKQPLLWGLGENFQLCWGVRDALLMLQTSDGCLAELRLLVGLQSLFNSPAADKTGAWLECQKCGCSAIRGRWLDVSIGGREMIVAADGCEGDARFDC